MRTLCIFHVSRNFPLPFSNSIKLNRILENNYYVSHTLSSSKCISSFNCAKQRRNFATYDSLLKYQSHVADKNVGLLFGRCTTLRSSCLTSQKRNFSLKESFESAVTSHTAIFKSISESAVVEKAQNFVITFHDWSGCPWWLSVILSTICIRLTLTLPLALYQNYVVARLENIRYEMKDIVNDIRHNIDHEVRNRRWTERQAKGHFRVAVRKEWTRLIERDNCHPAKAAILALVQIPLWVILSTVFRNLVYKLPYNDAYAEMKWLELSVGGVAWFPNLILPDSFILPILLGITNLTIIEVQAMLHKNQQSKLQRYATNFFRGFSIFMIPVAATVPSCLTLYWVTSSAFGLCQNLTILSPRVRKICRIPLSPSAHEHPYSHLAEQIRNRFRLKT